MSSPISACAEHSDLTLDDGGSVVSSKCGFVSEGDLSVDIDNGCFGVEAPNVVDGQDTFLL